METKNEYIDELDSATESYKEMETLEKSSNLSLESKHGKWRNKVDFIFACAASGIGLGNVWRFPYLCYINGGGAFLIPYLIFAFSTGLPIALLEVTLGQFTSYGGVKAWQICPLLQGIGAASVFMLFLGSVHYSVILSWAFYYLFSSFTSVLPWAGCDHSWNTMTCYAGNETILNGTDESLADIFGNNSRSYVKSDPVTEFWENKVLAISEGISELGNVKWDLSLCLLLTYFVINICIRKGIKNSRILLYIIVCTPFLLLTVLLVKGITLPGSLNGIKYYLLPDWGRLADSRVWADAGTQVFYSYNIGTGVLITLGSYNKYNHNCLRDACIFISINIFTSLFSGFVIFSVLGFMAHNLGVSIANVAESGPGLSFVAYPKALAKMPLAPFWSILFFITLLLLGLSTMLGTVETVVATVMDLCFKFLKKGWHRQLVLLITTCICFLLGLPMITNGGMYILQLADFFVSGRMGVLIGVLECFVIAYLYGLKRFNENVKSMLGHGLNLYVKVCWLVITPVANFVVFVLGLYNYTEVVYNNKYRYPVWAVCCGWILACTSMLLIPAVAISRILRTPGTLIQRLRKLIQPKEHDGDYLEVQKEVPVPDQDNVERMSDAQIVISAVRHQHC